MGDQVFSARRVLTAGGAVGFLFGATVFATAQGVSADALGAAAVSARAILKTALTAQQLPTDGGAAPIAPGKERWQVKTLSDPDAGSVNLTNVIDITLGALGNNPATTPWQNVQYPPDQRILSGPYAETQVYRVHALLVAARLESDGDFHLMLQDASSSATGIAEVPDPDFVQSQDPNVTSMLTAVRSKFVSLFGTPPQYPGTFTPANPVPVVVTGVRFFDVIHGQDNVAPNGVELHPVTALDLDSAAAPGVAPAAP